MTGQELFHALSFVDERYIMEAETARLGKTPWVKILSVAACLCILITGVFALGQTRFKGATEMAPAADAPAAAAPKEDAQTEHTDNSSAESSLAPGELCHVAYARLQVVSVLEDGSFEAIAEATEDMQVDTPVTVVVDSSKVPGGEDIVADAIGVVVGTKIEIYDGAYDTENNTLYIAQWLPIE